MVMNWFVRVCFRIQMRSGTLLLALLINAFSPPSSLLVIPPFLVLDFFFSSADNWKELGNELSYFLFMKVNHLGQQFGKFLSYMVNWIPLNWSELLLLMDMILRLNGYSLIHVKFFLSFFLFFCFFKYLLYISLEMLKQPYQLDFSPIVIGR